ncbi:4-HFC-P synthase [Methanobrevibacter arboriphilus JCM 13429 = DSM 1125]|uniref:(5-formylfuran-3-yl)methyl phosphate synthase n=1 Tax=Methanobrevibacter arboriphilus JCM 13429 = DSM 1125 TaxID=1300164 RepID=A0A1V6N0D2_METAZ|nr:(5-formylfuran-3-yl)methyl phosphate synthase [Methanobrevibacter arboriphilus]OQD58067.1 4-HFC-P synthase [Methanobrevibacter arboriphilus JCM 13429 = DSM 1125]
MLLLISPINNEEALESIEGGADIVDVKNPKEGSLGANFPWVISEIRKMTPDDMLVSATLGDVPYKPGTVSLAAMGALTSGADYIKVGLYGTSNYDEALEVMTNVVKTVKSNNPNATVVASGYGDAHRVGAVSPWDIPKVAKESGSDLAMLDTAVKDGKTLFDYLNIDDLKKFVEETHSYGLKSALAGSVKKEQLKPLYDIGCDVVGVRGAACTGGDRNNGKISRTAVAELKELVNSFD